MALVNSSIVGLPVTFVKDDGLGNSNGVLDHSATSADAGGKPVLYITDLSKTTRDHSATSKDSNGQPVYYSPLFPTGTRGIPAHSQNLQIVYVLDTDITNVRPQDHQATSADSKGQPIKYVPNPAGADNH